ncbi:MAG: hypothetical protein ABI414_04780 [Devosia sp.]
MDRIMPLHISRRRLAVLKTTLRIISPAIGSSHADEALASALGFKTHASLLAALADRANGELELTFTEDRMMSRLHELGYAFTPDILRRFSHLIREAVEEESIILLRDAASKVANDNG